MGIELLYEYQQQENNYCKLMSQINEIRNDKTIKRLKEENYRLKEEYIGLSSKKSEMEKEILKRRLQYKKLLECKTNYENLLYSPEINNVKKLESLKKQIAEAEKNILSEKSIIDDLEKNVDKIDDEIIKVKKKFAFIKKKYNKLKNENQYKLEFLIKEKNCIEELLEEIKLNIDNKMFDEYIKMKETLNNPVSEIRNRKCSGCGVEVPAIDYESAKNGNSIKCQNCGRILIYLR